MKFLCNNSGNIFKIDEFGRKEIFCGLVKDDMFKCPEEMTILLELTILDVVSH
jgi:hypothetical protein